MVSPLKYATHAQLLTAIRERFGVISGQELYALSSRINTAFSAGEFTDTEMRNAFGKTVAQWAMIKGKINNYAAAYDAMRNARGE